MFHLDNSINAPNSLGERAALANGDNVSNLDTESGRAVGGQVLVPLLVTRVLGHEVEVLPSDDDGAGHLGRHNLAGEDATTDRDLSGERALLVDVGTVDGLLGGL